MIATRSFVKNFAPAFVAGSTSDMEARLAGLSKTVEVLGLEAEISVQGISTAAAFALGESDADTIVNQVVKTVRASYNTETDNVNVSPDRLRDVAAYAMGQDPYNLYSRIGISVPISSGSAITFTFPIRIPFVNVNKENKNQNALSGAQLNRDGRVNLDSTGFTSGALAATVLTSGTMNITIVNSIKLYAVLGRKRKVGFVAPTQYIRARNQPLNPDTEVGPFYDEFVFETRDPRTLDGVIGSLSIEVDGDTPVKAGTTSQQLAVGFIQQTLPMTAAGGISGTACQLAYDITNNGRRSGQTGRTPFVWSPGAIAPDESEVPAVNSYRTFYFSTTANGTIVYWRLAPIDNPKTRDAIAGVVADNPEFRAAAGLTLDQLAVKGGGSVGPGAMNGTLRRYKAVWLSATAGA